MYLSNKYTEWYNRIIAAAKTRVTTDYIERHHIVPKSLGGDNKKDNIVRLTAREHFICHLLLPKMTVGENQYKMSCAVWRMCNSKKNKIYKISSRTYSTLKETHAANLSSRLKGVPKSAEHRSRISASHLGKTMSKEHCASIKRNHHDCTGSKNSAARTWTLTSPNGEVYVVIGQMESKCNELGIPPFTMQKLANKGKIPTKYSKCYGWQCSVV